MKFTRRERMQMRGYCTGPHDRVPAPGDVGLGFVATCFACGKIVKVTVRGLYAHHKPLVIAGSDRVTKPRRHRLSARANGGTRTPTVLPTGT